MAFFLTLKMEATFSSKTSVDFRRTTWCYIPEDRTLHNHCCENLKSCIGMKSSFFWHIMSYSPLKVNGHLGGAYSSCLQFNMKTFVPVLGI
jgi:hypothetical protein